MKAVREKAENSVDYKQEVGVMWSKFLKDIILSRKIKIRDNKGKEKRSLREFSLVKSSEAKTEDVVYPLFPAVLDQKKSTKVIFEITKDSFFLEQYYGIREEIYKNELGLNKFSGAEDDFDRQGEVMVIRLGEEVIGGGRINYSCTEQRLPLVLEEENFDMLLLFPELNLEKAKYCEFSRLVIKSQYRYGCKMLGMLVEKMIRQAQSSGAEYLFTVSPLTQAKAYRMICKKLGLDYLIDTIKIPEKQIYEGIPMVLARMKLTLKVEEGMNEVLLVN